MEAADPWDRFRFHIPAYYRPIFLRALAETDGFTDQEMDKLRSSRAWNPSFDSTNKWNRNGEKPDKREEINKDTDSLKRGTKHSLLLAKIKGSDDFKIVRDEGKE